MTNISNISRSIFNSSRQKGFSLIELIIVIALIGIVSAIAIPQLMQQMTKMRVNSAARQVLAKMLLLRVRAVSENKGYQIIFTLGGNTYQIKQDGNRNQSFADAADTIVETATLPAGIVFGSNATIRTDGISDSCVDGGGICFGGNAVSFWPSGKAMDGNGAALTTGDIAGKGNSVYLIPSVDKGTTTADRMRALSVDSVGRVKPWQYSGGGWTKF